MRDFDQYAEDAIKRRNETRANWSDFCDRQGWHGGYDYSTGARTPDKYRWSRKTFRYALSKMPKDHEDRWKYIVGARWADLDNASHLEFAKYVVVGILLCCVVIGWLFIFIDRYGRGDWLGGTGILALGLGIPGCLLLWRYHDLYK